MSRVSKIKVDGTASIKQATKLLNETGMQIVLVVDENDLLLGTITDGDIRRAILTGLDMSEPATRVMNRSPHVLFENERDRAVAFMKEKVIRAVPLIDADRRVQDLVSWMDRSGEKQPDTFETKTNPVFILAGGKGTRLKPFTKILPKPLIPIGDVPILEIIMERLQGFGFSDFVLSLNYKAAMIKAYFSEMGDKFSLDYVEEEQFLGTGGSLHLIKDRVKESVLVTNCDVIIDLNFDEYLSYHKKSGFDASVVGVMRHVKIQYGVIGMEQGELTTLTEKPEYDYVVNAGIYILEPHVLDYVEDNKYLDMPTLLLRVKEGGGRVGVYPVSAEMIDVGHWEEYKKAVEHLHRFDIV
ncbi:MAG: nucleotidyltransferase family protein [Leptospiraceae bacterium]|nr:nucleotidyltransferase family protein [Leptospiraceae bacterium]